MSSTKFVFFGPIGKTRWLPWPLIGWEIFDFSSETTERNSTKLDGKQDLNVLHQVCVFWAHRKNRWPPWPLICWDIFDFSSETTELNSTKLDRKQDLNILYQVCVFLADRKNKMAALASDWLRHFRLLLWNRWTEFGHLSQLKTTCPNKIGTNWPNFGQFVPTFLVHLSRRLKCTIVIMCCASSVRPSSVFVNFSHFRLLLWNHWMEFDKTWQEARSQRPLPSLCFSGRSEKQNGLPGLWLAETF